MPTCRRDADYWRERAQEARKAAEGLTTPTTKQDMLEIAAAYDRMALHVERTSGKKGARLPV